MTDATPFRPTVIEVVKQGPAGPAIGDWRGAWVAGTYRRRVLVEKDGSTWLARRDTSGVPGASADWDLVVAKGDVTPEAEAAKVAAEAARDQAQQAVANPSVAYDLLSSLNADLAHAAGTVGQVLADGTNNGFYVKVGGMGTGSWSKKSNATVPGLDARTAFVDTDDGGLSGWLHRLIFETVSSRLQLYGFDQAGAFYTKYPGGLTLDTAETVEGHLGRFLASDGSVILAFHADGSVEGKLSSPTVSQAVSDVAALTARVDQSTSAAGDLLQPCLNSWRLIRLHQRLRLLADQDSGAQLVINLYGDSWTDNPARWGRRMVDALVSRYGDAGPGWVGFAFNPNPHNNARPSVVTTVVSAGWTANWYGGGGPDLGSISSTTAASKVTVTGPAGLTSVRLFAEGTADGAARYRWDAGSWESLSLVGSGLMTLDLASIPAGAFTLEIEVVSGTCKLFGADLKNASRGVRVNKLGVSGSTSSNWAAGMAQATWAPAVQALGADAHFIMLGTNDQNRPWYPADFTHYMGLVVDAIRGVDALANIALVHPPENPRSPQVQPMAPLTAAARAVAMAKQCASLDLQYVFGDGAAPANYDDWFEADDIHPTQPGGAPAIAAAVMHYLLHLTP